MRKKVYKEALELIHNRKSVRSFTGEKIDEEDLLTILKAGMSAPSAVNQQPWEFIVVREKEILDKLADGLPYAKMLYKAGAAIVVCGIPEKAYKGLTEFAITDTCSATENILLAIEALGLGGVWTAGYPDEEKMNHIRNILNIPENIIPLNVIPIGYPTADEEPKEKFKENNIHWEKW